jgi:hypothetical protein
MFIVLNNGERTSSPDVTTSWPNTLEIDYIQVYKKVNGNLLVNNGFESGSAIPWSSYGTSSIVPNNQRSGLFCACVGADNSGFECTVTGLKPGTKYIFKGYVKSTRGLVNIGVKDYGGIQQSASTRSSAYAQLSVPFTTGATNTSAKVCFYKYNNGAGKSYGDDFELVESR